ncbi:anti-sigma-D factor RsdA [Mycobacterium sp. 236(2023)]|uniref:anti-sigma-D factor RsdA n=1 Tax=Mycobacterium sp. 236(2023) TaxID=3038163 RepID=UPI0024150CC6|nr:anti-sigma-D factor RsdA [Mycobacterium sp. 236(2023)]MDG4664075.1 anti-sigma-D factor RsdA [Mycobacterium sp. 236(2023)]
MPDFGRWNASGGDPSLNEINRTDQFLDALAAQQRPYVIDRDEAELAQLLAGWRDDVRETPMGHVLTPQDAAAALDRVTKPAPRRRFSLAVVGSAAAAMLAIGGFGAVVAGSGPGDALYGLRTMLFGEQQTKTRDDAVILAAQTEMQQVQQLIDQGDWAGAQQRLEAVTTTVATVNDFEQKQELITQWQELTVKVEAQDPVATVAPDVPLPTFPDIPTELLDPATVPLAPWETSSGTSTETTPSTPPSSGTSPETTPPSSATSAPSSTPSTSVGATQSSTTAPTSTAAPTTTAPTTTRSPSPTSTTSTAAPTSTTAPTTTTRSPSPTSTTIVVQSTTTTRAPLPTPSAAVPAPTPTAAPIPTPEAPLPTPEAPSPTVALVPTTTTPVLPGADSEG